MKGSKKVAITMSVITLAFVLGFVGVAIAYALISFPTTLAYNDSWLGSVTDFFGFINTFVFKPVFVDGFKFSETTIVPNVVYQSANTTLEMFGEAANWQIALPAWIIVVLVVIFLIIWVIMIIVKKRPGGLIALLIYLLASFAGMVSITLLMPHFLTLYFPFDAPDFVLLFVLCCLGVVAALLGIALAIVDLVTIGRHGKKLAVKGPEAIGFTAIPEPAKENTPPAPVVVQPAVVQPATPTATTAGDKISTNNSTISGPLVIQYFGCDPRQMGSKPQTCTCDGKEQPTTKEEVQEFVNKDLHSDEPVVLKQEVTADDVRNMVKEAVGEQEKPIGLTAEEIRNIIKEELAALLNKEEKKDEPVVEETKAPTTVQEQQPIIVQMPTIKVVLSTPTPVEVQSDTPVETEVQAVETPVEEEPVVEETPEVIPEPVLEEPVVEEEPIIEEVIEEVVEEVEEVEEEKQKIIRIPFTTRIVNADDEMKANFNELKSEIMSYGVHSRVSNSGDTFRLHAVTFVKITIAGKSLKLYYALNPQDYASSTLPIADAGNKGTYAEIPLVFKVKSPLSLRRAKQLIADVMEKNGLEQGEVELKDWVKEIAENNK